MDKMSRRGFLRLTARTALGVTAAHLVPSILPGFPPVLPGLVRVTRADAALGRPRPTRPHILLICIDDLNDWPGCLGGYPPGLVRPEQISPNIDRFAREAVIFTNAYCSTPACGPSRAGLLWGLGAWSTGVQVNTQRYSDSPVLSFLSSLPQWLRENGYYTMAVGKVGHHPIPPLSGAGSVWDKEGQMFYPSPVPPVLPANGIPDLPLDWGQLEARKEDMGDWQTVQWVKERLAQDYHQPWFLACGFVKPHRPWYVSREFFDLFPLEEVALPVVLEDDLLDVPVAGQKLARIDQHAKIVAAGKWKEAIQAYLACISFTDACIGEILAALARSPYRDNTVVVIWSDNGHHLGEKGHWNKFTLWLESLRTLLAIRAPGISVPGRCSTPVTGLDVYPTLMGLAGLPLPDHLGGDSPFEFPGRSLVRCLRDPSIAWGRPVHSQLGNRHLAIISKHWQVNAYTSNLSQRELLGDWGLELYRYPEDLRQWHNLAVDPHYVPFIVKTLAKWAPTYFAPPAPKVRK